MHQNAKIDTAAEILTILRDDIDIQVPSPDSELLESGLLDSMKLVDLIVVLEKRFEVQLDLISLDFGDLESVQSLARLVDRRASLGS